MDDCIFCKIASKNVAADILYEDETAIAFWDIHPIAPIHILIIPKKHIVSINEIDPSDIYLMGQLILISREIAYRQHLETSGYRLMINNGPDAGQSVYHLHFHLLGGKKMSLNFQ
jgi:histidine triad (HIT) family protein